MITYYDNDFSTCAQKVRMLLNEKGAQWSTVWLDLRQGDQFDPEYLKLNPNGVVPTIVHDGNVIIESTLILRYLDEVLGAGPQFTPADPARRYDADLWMAKLDAMLHYHIAALSIGVAFRHELAEAQQDQIDTHLAKVPNPILRDIWAGAIYNGLKDERFRAAIAGWNNALDQMEARLSSSSWLVGEAFTIADMSYIPYLVRLDHLGLWDTMKAGRPNVQRWYGAMQARPSFKAAFTDTIDTDKIAFVTQCGKECQPQTAPICEELRAV